MYNLVNVRVGGQDTNGNTEVRADPVVSTGNLKIECLTAAVRVLTALK